MCTLFLFLQSNHPLQALVKHFTWYMRYLVISAAQKVEQRGGNCIRKQDVRALSSIQNESHRAGERGARHDLSIT